MIQHRNPHTQTHRWMMVTFLNHSLISDKTAPQSDSDIEYELCLRYSSLLSHRNSAATHGFKSSLFFCFFTQVDFLRSDGFILGAIYSSVILQLFTKSLENEAWHHILFISHWFGNRFSQMFLGTGKFPGSSCHGFVLFFTNLREFIHSGVCNIVFVLSTL